MNRRAADRILRRILRLLGVRVSGPIYKRALDVIEEELGERN